MPVSQIKNGYEKFLPSITGLMRYNNAGNQAACSGGCSGVFTCLLVRGASKRCQLTLE